MFHSTGNLHLSSGMAVFMETGEAWESAIPFNIYPFIYLQQKGKGAVFRLPFFISMQSIHRTHELNVALIPAAR